MNNDCVSMLSTLNQQDEHFHSRWDICAKIYQTMTDNEACKHSRKCDRIESSLLPLVDKGKWDIAMVQSWKREFLQFATIQQVSQVMTGKDGNRKHHPLLQQIDNLPVNIVLY